MKKKVIAIMGVSALLVVGATVKSKEKNEVEKIEEKVNESREVENKDDYKEEITGETTEDINLEYEKIQVKLENKELEEKINKLVENKINESGEELKEEAKKYRDAFLETGGEEENFLKVEGKVGSEVKFMNDKYISVLIYKAQSSATGCMNSEFYTYDMKTGEIVELEDLKGENYKEEIKSEVLKEINEREKNDEYEIYLKDFEIDEETKFYINDKGDIVIFFDRYEIAAGAKGDVEFEIEI